MSNKYLVLQTDFGLQDGAVSSMYGVAYGVSDAITVSDLTHGITPFNIFEGSFRLSQTVKYWQPGTVFVSVVDPGVGSKRLSIVAKLKSGHYVVTPDNGTLTHLAANYGIEAVRVLDETTQRLPGSEESSTFHGRDIYAYNGARLASGQVTFEELGTPLDPTAIVQLPLNLPVVEDGAIEGNVDITDVNFGSLWSNIGLAAFKELEVKLGDLIQVTVFHKGQQRYSGYLPYVHTFDDVQPGEPLVYIDSVYTVAFGVHTGSFAQQYNVGAGEDWSVKISKIN